MQIIRPSGMKYVARGDPAAYDFTQATLTIDSDWHSLNLSSIIPASAKLVHTACVISNTAGGKIIKFRKPGLSNDYAIHRMWSLAGFVLTEREMTIPVVSQAVSYMVENVAWNTIGFTVLGWWL